MSNDGLQFGNITGNVTIQQAGGDIVAGNKTIINQIIQQAAKQIVTAPYKFLASYDISDHDIFFGRDAVIDKLVGKLPRYKTLVINGRSGSGKTSLINAGLIRVWRKTAIITCPSATTAIRCANCANMWRKMTCSKRTRSKPPRSCNF